MSDDPSPPPAVPRNVAPPSAANTDLATVAHAASRPGSGLQVRCPHCRNPIELTPDAELESIRCGSCGSDFSLTTEADEGTRDARNFAEVGHFKLVERVGMGAFGTVWKALDTELDRTVAVKIPRTGQLSKQQQELFLREARSAAQLRHPNIVPVYEVGRVADTLYIVSEFVRGVTLADRLTAGPLTRREAAELCAHVADALHHAHEQGVIHRDLKPANIMIDAQGAPHLMDFGLARRDAGEVTMTIEGQVLGTPAFMSPEQARGDAHAADRRTDVYSLGVLLFQLLTGELPFRGNARMTIHQVIHDEPPSPRTLNGAVPRDLETLTLKCLEKDPKRRPGSAAELAAELRRHLAGVPIQSRPISRVEHAWRWCQRNRAVAGLAGVVASLLVAIALAGPLMAWRQSRLRERAEMNEHRATQLAAAEASAREAAEAARQLEQEQRQVAEQLVEVNRRQLVRMNELQGDAMVERNDPAGALPWYIEALRLDAGDAEREQSHRLRLAMMLRGLPKFLQLWRHDAAVTAMAFSPDERWIATASHDHTARVWDLETGEAVTPPLEHDSPVLSCAFSADGKRLVTAGGSIPVNGELRVWEVPSGKLIGGPLRNARTTYFYAGFTGEGDVLVAEIPMDGDGTVRLRTPDLRDVAQATFEPYAPSEIAMARPWHTASGRVVEIKGNVARVVDLDADVRDLCTLNVDSAFTSAHFSGDGSRVFTAAANRLSVWDAVTGEELVVSGGYPSGWEEDYTPTLRARFSRDNQRVTIAGPDRQVMTFDLAGKTIADLATLPDVRNARSYISGDARFIAVAARDSAVRVWDVRGAKLLFPPLPHTAAVSHAIFSADNQLLVTGCSDGSVRVWDLRTGNSMSHRFSDPGVGALSVADDGKTMTTFSRSAVRGWDISSGRRLSEFVSPGPSPQSAFFDDDAKVFVTVYGDGTARVWKYETGQEACPPLSHAMKLIRDAKVSPDGKYLATIDVESLEGHRAVLGNANVWDISTGRSIVGPFRFSGLISAIGCIEFSPDSRVAAIGGGAVLLGGGQPRLALVELASGKEIEHSFEHAPECGIFALDFDAQGRYLASITLNPLSPGRSELRIVDLLERRQVGKALRFTDDATGLRIDDHSQIVACAVANQVHLRRLATGDAVVPPLLHDEHVERMEFSPDGRWLATSTRENMIRIWDTTTGRAVGPPLPHPAKVRHLQITGCGTLVSACADGLVRTWPFAPLEGPLEDVAAMARLLSATKLLPSQVVAPLGLDELSQDWSRLKGAYPADFRGSELQAVLWHDQQATDCFNRGDWLAAIPHFEQLAKLDGVNHWNFGNTLCDAGILERGIDEFLAGVLQEPEGFWLWYSAAVAQLGIGRIADYGRTCERMLGKLGETDDPRIASDIAKICLLGPTRYESDALPFELAARAMAKEDGHPMSSWIRLTGALAAYRRGDYARADQLLTQLIAEPIERERTASARFLLAMTRWRQDRRDEARAELEEAAEFFEAHPLNNFNGAWRARLLVECLQREAAQLIAE